MMSDEQSLDLPGFELIAKIGEGGMGAVYKARQLSLDRLVAIKALPAAFADHPDYIRNFQAEAKIEATLKHPNIVQIYEAGHVGSVYFFVMEYVAGETVAELLDRKGRLQEEEVLALAESVAMALEYAWSKARIVHGDVKPGNIMIDDDGTAKLGDFLALTKLGAAGPASATTEHILGTLNYMSPEQLVGTPRLDCRTDIYSLGAVIYHLLSGRLPFAELSEDDSVEAYLAASLPDIRDAVPGVSEGTAWFIEKLLVRDAALRTATWDEVLRDVEAVRNRGLPENLPPEGRSAMRRSAQRRRPETDSRIKPPQLTQKLAVHKGEMARVGEEEEAVQAVETPVARVAAVVVLGLALLVLGVVFLRAGGHGELEPVTETLLGPPPPILLETPTEDVEATPTMAEVVATETEEAPAEDMVAAPSPDEQAAAAPERDAGEAQGEFSVHPAAPVIDPARIAELMQYTALATRTRLLMQRKDYGRARRLLVDWQAANPDTAYAEDVTRQLERVSLAEGLLALLHDNHRNLHDVEVEGRDGRSGVVKDLKNGKLTIKRKVDGLATIDINLMSLSQGDMYRLIGAADPDHANVNKAIFALAAGDLDKARDLLAAAQGAGEDTTTIEAWIADQEHEILNYEAYRALADVTKLLRKKDFAGAEANLSAARIQYSDSDVFGPLAPSDLEKITTALQAWNEAQFAALNAPSESPADTAGGDDVEGFAEEVSEAETPAGGEGFRQLEVDSMSPAALQQHFDAYDQKLVQLAFSYRGGIQSLPGGDYKVFLFGEGVVEAWFAADALPVVEAWPSSSNRAVLDIYALVHGADERVELMGRKRKTLVDGSIVCAW